MKDPTMTRHLATQTKMKVTLVKENRTVRIRTATLITKFSRMKTSKTRHRKTREGGVRIVSNLAEKSYIHAQCYNKIFSFQIVFEDVCDVELHVRIYL